MFIVLMILIIHTESKLRLSSKKDQFNKQSDNLERIELSKEKNNEDSSINKNNLKKFNYKLNDIQNNYRYEDALANFLNLFRSKSDIQNYCDNIKNNLFDPNINQNYEENIHLFNNNNSIKLSYYENFLLSVKQKEYYQKIKSSLKREDIKNNLFYRDFKNTLKGLKNKAIQINKPFNGVSIQDQLYILSNKSSKDMNADDLILKLNFAEFDDHVKKENQINNYLKLKLKNKEMYFKLKFLYFHLNSMPIILNKVNSFELCSYPAQLSLIMIGIDKDGKVNNNDHLVLNVYFSQNNDNNFDDEGSKDVNNNFKKQVKDKVSLDMDIGLLDSFKKEISEINNLMLNSNKNQKNFQFDNYSNSTKFEKLNQNALFLKNLLYTNFNYTENFGDNFIDSLENVINIIFQKQLNTNKSSHKNKQEKILNKSIKGGLDVSILNSILENSNSNFDVSSIKIRKENEKDCELFHQIDLVDNIPLSYNRLHSFKKYLTELNKSIESKNEIKLNEKLHKNKENTITHSFLKRKKIEGKFRKNDESDLYLNPLIDLLNENKIKKSKLYLNEKIETPFSPLYFSSFKLPLNEELQKFENQIITLEDSFSYLLNSNKIIIGESTNLDMIKMLDNFYLIIRNYSNNSTEDILHRKANKENEIEEDQEEEDIEDPDSQEENDDDIIYRDKPSEENNNDEEIPHPKKHKKKHKKKKHHKHHKINDTNQTPNSSDNVTNHKEILNKNANEKNNEQKDIQEYKENNQTKELKGKNEGIEKKEHTENKYDIKVKNEENKEKENQNKSENEAKLKKKKHKKKHKKHHKKNHTHHGEYNDNSHIGSKSSNENKIENNDQSLSSAVAKNISNVNHEEIKKYDKYHKLNSTSSVLKNNQTINKNSKIGNYNDWNNNKKNSENNKKIDLDILLNYLDSIKIVPVLATHLENESKTTKNNTVANSNLKDYEIKKDDKTKIDNNEIVNNTSIKNNSNPKNLTVNNKNITVDNKVIDNQMKPHLGTKTNITLFNNKSIIISANKTSINNSSSFSKNNTIYDGKDFNNMTQLINNSSKAPKIFLPKITQIFSEFNNTDLIKTKINYKEQNETFASNYSNIEYDNLNKSEDAAEYLDNLNNDKTNNSNIKTTPLIANESLVLENKNIVHLDTLNNTLESLVSKVDEHNNNETIEVINHNNPNDNNININVNIIRTHTTKENFENNEAKIEEQKTIIPIEKNINKTLIDNKDLLLDNKTKEKEIEKAEEIILNKDTKDKNLTDDSKEKEKEIYDDKNKTKKDLPLNDNIKVQDKDIFPQIAEKGNSTLSKSIPRISRKQNLKISGNDVIFDETIIFGDSE